LKEVYIQLFGNSTVEDKELIWRSNFFIMSKSRNNTASIPIPIPPTSEIYVAGYLLSSNKGLSDLTKRLETVQLALRQFGQTRETSTAPAGLDNIASSLVNDSIIRSKSPVCI
jgi:hypothetical protein